MIRLILILVEYVSLIASGLALLAIPLSMINILDRPVVSFIGYFIGFGVLSGICKGVENSMAYNDSLSIKDEE